ncbi:hypothetical protein Tco_1208038 [Tanacetum coccineum]
MHDVDPIFSAEDMEAFETDESAPTHVPSPRRCTARMSIRPQTPMSATAEALIVEDGLPEADMSLWKRARFTTPASGFKVGKSSAADAARQPVLDVATVDATPGRLVSGESEARHAREAWSHSMNYSKAVHVELQAYRAQVNIHEIQIQTRDTRIGSLETLVATLVAQTSSLQT